MSKKTIATIKFVILFKIIVAAAAVFLLPREGLLMCSLFVAIPDFFAMREMRPGSDRFMTLVFLNLWAWFCMSVAIGLGAEIEGVTYKMFGITCALWTILFGIPLDFGSPVKAIEQKQDDKVYEVEVVE